MGEQYGADQIQILEGLEAVRKRPGMYIGSTSARGLHHLVYEIVDNAVDEALAGYCDSIDVTINEDNSITVMDDGRGIPVDIQKKAGLPAVEVVFTILHAGGKFGNGGYKVSGGLHGVGASVVNALSEWLEVQVYKDGNIYQQRYERGKVTYPLKIVGKCGPEQHGTRVTFLPDKEIFEETVYDYDTLKIRLRETAFLTKNLKIILKDDRDEKKEKVFHYEGGIKEFVTYLNKGKTPIYDQVIYCEGTREGVYVEVSMQHNDYYTENIYKFVNNINTPEGGTHLTGFKNALTKTFNDYAREKKLLKDSEDNLSGEDIREGLTAIISVKIEDPQFEGQTKQKLGNSEARAAVDNIVSEQLTYFLEQNPASCQVLRTDEEGTITAFSDGKTITWSTGTAAVPGSSVNQTAAIPDTDNGAAAENEAGDPSTRSSYVINTNTGKFHRPDCASATQMKPENRKDVTASRDELVQEGYEPCKQCKP